MSPSPVGVDKAGSRVEPLRRQPQRLGFICPAHPKMLWRAGDSSYPAPTPVSTDFRAHFGDEAGARRGMVWMWRGRPGTVAERAPHRRHRLSEVVSSSTRPGHICARSSDA